MSLDFLSGLLLATVVVFGLIYMLKEWFGARMPTFAGGRREEPAGGANAHLIGATGRVVDASRESGEMRVRIGMERWTARLHSAAGAGLALPVGTEVEVKAVHGLVLEVAERSAPAVEPET